MNTKSFEQWCKDNAEILEELEANPTPCSNCDGSGECQCDCGDIHDCRNCDGTGKVNRDAARQLYKKSLRVDQDNLQRWAKAPIHA